MVEDGPKYRLLASDVDGTLIDGNQRLSARDRDAVRRLVASGNVFTLATGRVLRSVVGLIDELGVRWPVILCNGASVWDVVSGQPLFQQPLHREAAVEIGRLIEREEIPALAYADETFYASFASERIAKQCEKDGVEWAVASDWTSLLANVGGPILKLMLLGDPGRMDELEAGVLELPGVRRRRPAIVRSEPDLLEVMSAGSSKGAALRWLANYLGVGLDQTVAIGDSLNDIDLLKSAGLGVAVTHAHRDLLQVADLVVDQGVDRPVAWVIERHFGC